MATPIAKHSQLFAYNAESLEHSSFESIDAMMLNFSATKSYWLNTYDISNVKELQSVVVRNKFDEFHVKLIKDQFHPNKIVVLEHSLFIGINTLHISKEDLTTEQMNFVVTKNFVWSMQEKKGDHFDWIRALLAKDTSLVRKKKADYLLYYLLESIIDNYTAGFAKTRDSYHSESLESLKNGGPKLVQQIEERKNNISLIKKHVGSYRDMVLKLERVTLEGFKTSYFSELREQANSLLADLDYEIKELDGAINLFFSIQGHKLNEVMKTLTLFSVIFIPLTFIAGIYGMNFSNIPLIANDKGYFVIIGLMLLITAISLYLFKRKHWF
jgi:magnesium transporter